MRRKWLILWYMLLAVYCTQVFIYWAASYAVGYYSCHVRRQFNAEASAWQEVDKVPYAGLINSCSRSAGVSARLVAAVIETESSFQPNARSPAGAYGLMQIMPSTWQEVNRELKVCEGRHPGQCTESCYQNPELNIRIGTAYLARLYSRYGGNATLAVAAYNAGPGAVDRCGGIPVNGETEHYVERVTENWYKYGEVKSLVASRLARGAEYVKNLAGWGLVLTTIVLLLIVRRMRRRYKSWRWS